MKLIGMFGFAATALCAAAGSAQTGEPFKIGALFPMTGIAAPTGVASEVGARMAVKELNSAGGIMSRQIQLIVADDQFDPTQSVTLAKKLATSDKVQAVLGPQGGALVIAVGPVMAEADVAYFSAGTTGLMTPQAAPTGFSVSIIPEAQAVSVIDWAIDVRKAKSIGYFGDNGLNSKTMAERFKAYAAERKLTIAAMEQYEVGATEMTSQILNLRRANPDVLLINGQTAADQARILKQIDEVGWNVPVAGSLGVTALFAPIAQIAGSSTRLIAAGVQIKTFSYCTGDPVGELPYAKFLQRLKTESPGNFEKLPYNLSAWTYDAVFMIKAASEGAKSTGGRAMTQWIENNKQGVLGVTGVMKADAASHFLARPETFTLVENLDRIRSDGMIKRAGC